MQTPESTPAVADDKRLPLFEPLALRGVTLKNRLVVSPMCQYQSRDGYASDFHLVHYGKFALGGFGLVMVEATGVSPEGRISPGDLGIWDDAHVEGLSRVAAAVKEFGGVPGIQIAHAGPKASTTRPWHGSGPLTDDDAAKGEAGWQVVSSSAKSVAEGLPVPVALDADGIAKVRYDFANAARRALRAGFEVVEIHAAHGYLLNSFLSPLANTRTDEYGGSLENRMRLVLEIAREVREIWPDDKPLFVRISAVDGSAEGWLIEDSVALARELKKIGVDLVDCSSGGFGVFEYATGYGYQVPFAARVREGAEISTMAVGLIVDPQQANEIVANGDADLVAIGHEALYNPYFPLHSELALGAGDSDDPYKNWSTQYGWWLNGRRRRIERLGLPESPLQESVQDNE